MAQLMSSTRAKTEREPEMIFRAAILVNLVFRFVTSGQREGKRMVFFLKNIAAIHVT